MPQPDLFDTSRTTHPPAGWQPDPLPDLHGETSLRLDFETNGLQWWAGDAPVGIAWMFTRSGRRGYSAFGHQGGGNSCDKLAAQRWLNSLRGVHIDNANTKFDLHMSRAGMGVDLTDKRGNTFGDVAHRAALLDDHRFRFGLDQLAKDFLSEDAGKTDLQLRDKGELWRLPAWEVAPYAVHDVVLVDQLVTATHPDIVKQELERVLDLEQQIIPVVVEMEKNGCFLDMDLLAQWTADARREYHEAMYRIFRAVGFHLSSPDSSKDIARLFKALSIPITAFTGSTDKAGNPKPSFAKDVLQRIDHPVIKDLLLAGELADLDSKYLGKYSATVRADGWIRFNLHQLRVGKSEDDKKGTVSGRFSSAGDEHGGFNVQQVVSPKKQADKHWCEKYIVRNLFKPAKGKTWLAVDADQIEYRIFAHFSNDPDILGKYHEDISAIGVEEAKRLKRGIYTDYHDIVQEVLKRGKPDIKRKHTKITNFCKLFGAAEIKFALTLELISQATADALYEKYAPGKWARAEFGERQASIRAEPCLQEALQVYDTYDRMFPAGKATLELAKQTARDRGYVKTIMGRRARFPGKQRTHSALNRAVQGTAADINKRVLVEVYNQREALGLTLRMTVHDELDSDMDDPGMLPQVEKVFNTQYIPLRVPILWSCETGPSWGQAKGKA
jgi:DNA polymerase-1